MNDLQKIRFKQDRVFERNIFETHEQDFSDFLSWNPNIYNGVNLTTADIDFINTHFARFKVEPETFELEFRQLLNQCVPRYNNMKAIELVDQVFDVTTNKTERKIIQDTTNELSRRNETAVRSENSGNSDSKNAYKEAPMNTLGNSFEDTVKWDKGASNFSENKNTSSNTVTQNDLQILKDLNEGNSESKDNYEGINEQYVILIKRIWNYLLAPKSTEYLIKALSQAFILVY